MNLEDKITAVKSILKDRKVALGFSGGADSTLIAYLSSKVASDTMAVTIDNHLMPTGFVENAKKACAKLGIKHHIIDIDFYKNTEFLKNTQKRCYTCRDMMYAQIRTVAEEKGFDYICDGNNITDLTSDRPGILITYKNNFQTPLIEARLTSAEIHQYLEKNSINYSKSTTCLATRIPTGTPATPEKIKRISRCEDYILNHTNCKIAKVRDLGQTSIVEVDNPDEILKDNAYKQINDELKQHGFKKVALNLSQIKDNEYLKLDYKEGSFRRQLPFTINIENTRRQLEEIIYESEDKIEIENITIHADGLIEGRGFESQESALERFMQTLTIIRRNI